MKEIWAEGAMELGNWDKAIIKTILLVSLIAPIYFLFAMGVPRSLGYISNFAVILLMFYFNYLLMSVVGWAVVGLPVHWLISKYGGGKLIWYLLAVVLLTGLMVVTIKHPIALIYGAAALIQVLLFKYYVYKPK